MADKQSTRGEVGFRSGQALEMGGCQCLYELSSMATGDPRVGLEASGAAHPQHLLSGVFAEAGAPAFLPSPVSLSIHQFPFGVQLSPMS